MYQVSSCGEEQCSFYYDRFMLGGGYDFLVHMEHTYDGCASICETPLFYLTRDMELGMPT